MVGAESITVVQAAITKATEIIIEALITENSLQEKARSFRAMKR